MLAATLLSLGMLYLHGTRLAYFSLLMTAAGFALVCLLGKLPRRYFALFLAACLLFACSLPYPDYSFNYRACIQLIAIAQEKGMFSIKYPEKSKKP